MEKLSVCIIAQNEERNLPRCIGSVSWADEVIVVENDSTDRTVEVAKEAGAKVIQHKWLGWGKQKNIAITAASHDWILSLDADEWLGEGAEKIVREAMAEKDFDAYMLPRRTYFIGRWIAHSGWYPDKQIRLFRKTSTRFEEVPVHEKVRHTDHTGELPLNIEHESFVNVEQFITKHNRYSTAQAEQQKALAYPVVQLILKPWYRFFQSYIVQRGFLDGREGFILAVLRMWYEFTVIAKILEKRRASHKAPSNTAE